MDTIAVHGPRPYEVRIGHGLDEEIAGFLAALDTERVAIVHQPPLADAARRLAGRIETAGAVRAHLLPLADAEAGKEPAELLRLWDDLGRLGLGRRDVVLGLGGGAATDLAGFLAATWMRGIRVVQAPTTLLGMVDAAVGGKTGVNTAAGKNLVGAFHEPAAVFADLDHLAELPAAELVAGSAEIIKTGFIADTVILDRYEADPDACLRPDGHLPELVRRSIAVKAAVVGEDLTEAGPREALNYGHTFGHAVERREEYRMRHGSAVAIGMMYVAHLAHRTGHVDAALVERHRAILRAIGLPVTYRPGHAAELLDAMRRDKKNRGGRIRFVVLDGRAGATTRLEGPGEEHLLGAYRDIAGPGPAAG